MSIFLYLCIEHWEMLEQAGKLWNATTHRIKTPNPTTRSQATSDKAKGHILQGYKPLMTKPEATNDKARSHI